MQGPTGQRERFFRSMGWFLPLFSFGMLLLLTGSKAEVKEAADPDAIICTCPAKAASELMEKLPNVSHTDSAEHGETSDYEGP